MKFPARSRSWSAPSGTNEPPPRDGTDPVEVADQIVQLKEADFDGIRIGFYDYMPDLDFFAVNVLPLLKERGLRIA